jgi:hypothetical protein
MLKEHIKKDLVKRINDWDLKNESSILSVSERQEKLSYELNLRSIISKEELKMKQKAREKQVVEGDGNTKYFHLKAKGRRRRIRIHSLLQNGSIVGGETELNKVATDYYKELFGPSNISHIRMGSLNMSQLDENDREFLISPFSYDEIKLVIHSLKHNSAPGPVVLPTEFFQSF